MQRLDVFLTLDTAPPLLVPKHHSWLRLVVAGAFRILLKNFYSWL